MAQWIPVPRPSYSQARENLVRSLPPNLICSLSCGGKLCRYEGPDNWSLQQQAIRGLYSEWVTGDIVAMARPSTTLIKKYNIIEQFTELNIKSIINMQVQGEHAQCGPPLERESGFSYVPQVFMEKGIYFFNFGMPDFGVSSLIRILDGVKVLTFALKEGKVAVHCHAGLGRTGVLLACYLIFATRVSPSEAVHFVRIKRPSSIQTQPQIDLVFDFARFLAPHLIMYANVDAKTYPFTLEQYLIRQKHLLHGYEARNLKHIPKIVDFTCKRLIMIALNKADSKAMQSEVERESFMHNLTHLIRQTLVRQTFLHITTLLNDPDNRLTPSVSSAISWGENEGFRKRKMEVLQDKRSYSASDLSKIVALEKNKALEPMKLPPEESNQPNSPGLGCEDVNDSAVMGCETLNKNSSGLGHENLNKDLNTSNLKTGDAPTAVAEDMSSDSGGTEKIKSEKKNKPAFKRFTTTTEESKKEQGSPGLGTESLSQAVAIAMAELEPIGNDLLKEIQHMQNDLNENEGAWAMLATETNPKVISVLMWRWLEQLKEPVLKSEDIGLLMSSKQDTKTIWSLHKYQGETICCILDCISQLPSLSPKMEEAIICRLIRALTQCLEKEVKTFTGLIELFKAIIKEKRSHNLFTKGLVKTKHMLKMSAIMKNKQNLF
ncbi:protein tyrosine phosphatase domain-containing protein 1-like [Polyodon spathula]|uniref:protein tyrosine phosphatase domain-containing protein 1-like n=1 Tax=Polyodon spathula TaxID=7913 RepID=UPI001B7E450A|nr:protein tyrosine phosphatase domain-containing protein 1-like [Polyodon spathula]XP_041113851.1 protein tyrosine phosphatase domain-containing protein 1-like [Polyodon spathula]